MTEQQAIPGDVQVQVAAAPHLVIAPSIDDPKSGAKWARNGDRYLEVVAPWAHEDHIPPVKAVELFGDMESFAAYIERFGAPDETLTTWNAAGLKATLDYHTNDRDPGRCQWTAAYPFTFTPEFRAWKALCEKSWMGQKAAVDELEPLIDTIEKPAGAELVQLFRDLRATHTAKSKTVLNPDGTSRVEFENETGVKAGNASLPHLIIASMQILVGHLGPVPDPDDKEKTVIGKRRFGLKIRCQVSVNTDAKLLLRFGFLNLEATLEAVFGERVADAAELLGSDYPILRAADPAK